MAQELIYDLHDPRYTIYHRAALGGLAATVLAWEIRGTTPPGITATRSADRVTLAWEDAITDREAVQAILHASFQIDKELIDLPGQAPDGMGEDLRLALHNGYCGTFLQHNKMRPAPPGVKGAKTLSLRDPDSEAVDLFTFKPVGSYAHQKAQGTGLLDTPSLPVSAVISQAIVPGALSGAESLEVSAKDGLLLLFLMVGSSVFILRSRAKKQKAQYCLVVPDVVDLKRFARALSVIAHSSTTVKPFSGTYLGRVVGGAEEAALKLLIDIKATEIGSTSVRGCLAITMGKVAWDANQINRSAIVPVRSDYEERAVFSAAAEAGRAKTVKLKSGESYAFPPSPLPELIAANLARGHHWAAHFRDLVSEKKEFQNMRFLHGGLVKMKEAIRDDDDRLLIKAFHEAWSSTMAGIFKDLKDNPVGAERRIDVRRERMRNEILRAKTQTQLAGWFLDFCARATEGKSLPTLRDPDSARRIRALLFDPRSFDRFQNLCLFALLSYAATEPKSSSTVSKQGE
jgi:CRISPR-associated protein Cas8a1/Csx13